jgi:DNA invertase Pin-like site-specific DNA recombinase
MSPKKTSRTVRAAIYSRVSTDKQTTQSQECELHEIAEREGWEIVETYRDAGISGAKGREARPAFDALCKDATRRRFDLIMAWSVDRLGRSLQDLVDLVAFLTEVHAARVDLFLHQQGLDTQSPAGRAMFQMMGVFAEFERAMIRERVNAGLARARAEGKKLGRPKIATETEKAIAEAIKASKLGMHKIAALHGVGNGTVRKIDCPRGVTCCRCPNERIPVVFRYSSVIPGVIVRFLGCFPA